MRVVGLLILGVSHFLAFNLCRLVELLTAAQLFDDTGLVEFAFEFLNRALDVLTFFYWNYDHSSSKRR